MIVATDVHYLPDGSARAAAVGFLDWPDASPALIRSEPIAEVAGYQPGRFFLRELPCLLAVLAALPQTPDIVLVDGYVTLGAEGRDGLGAHLFAALGGRVPVIGVAKTRFRGTPASAELLRGRSRHPLYVTARGLPRETALAAIGAMHGPYRLPTLLRLTDAAARGEVRP